MTREEACSRLSEAIESFDFLGERISYQNYGSGHINDTFLIINQNGDKKIKYIVQRMNDEIFKDVDQLMENVLGVTSFLRKKIVEKGGDPERETLNVVQTKDQKSYYKDSIGSCWRAYLFIEDAASYNEVEKPEQFYQSAVAFGRFQKLLSEYPAEKLHETIPDFHNTGRRFETFERAAANDVKGRASKVQDEIAFAMKRKKEAGICMDLLARGELPLRVTHNDTKLNNVMLDHRTGEGICVIDLDTVMPGLSINDFGDSIRFGANTGAEDERDLSKISLDLDLFDLYAKGFIGACGGSLTRKELEMLPMAAKLMTFECGIRFLTDYLEGDTYFKIHRPDHNLDRCRTQFCLITDMEHKWDAMNEIIKKYI